VHENHTGPSGTDRLFGAFQAINCQARIVQFLRNKVRTVDREDGSFHRSRLARRSLPEFKTMGRSRALAPPDTATNPSESWRRVFPYRI
jgi:hypothetical protein